MTTATQTTETTRDDTTGNPPIHCTITRQWWGIDMGHRYTLNCSDPRGHLANRMVMGRTPAEAIVTLREFNERRAALGLVPFVLTAPIRF